MWAIREAAECYALNSKDKEEKKAFRHSQKIRERLASQNKIQNYELSTKTAVNVAFDHLANAINYSVGPSGQMKEDVGHVKGHRYVKRVPKSGKYVVVSDHHITNSAHRHAFFNGTGKFNRYQGPSNAQLYADLLEGYNDRQYTLIENGDVEELVIFDPKQFPDEMGRRRKMSLEQVKEARRPVRLRQLEMILADQKLQGWLRQLERFDGDGRLLRVAGNHDFDLQRPDFFELFTSRFPHQKRIWDYVLIADGDDAKGQARYAVLHGHQFDLVSNPSFGARFGETISETSGLWFQGADRVWTYEDGPSRWVSGGETVMNWLVEDDPGQSRRVRVPSGGPSANSPPIRETSPVADGPLRKLIEGQIFHHNIAWEYFKYRSVPKILAKEVLRKNGRFFKFRHLDEEHIRLRMLAKFPDATTRPTLILGHSHEVRRDSYSIDHKITWPDYLNSGAAGRFENLIWAVEVVDGEAFLVSWSRDSPAGQPVRREWTTSGRFSLVPSGPKAIP